MHRHNNNYISSYCGNLWLSGRLVLLLKVLVALQCIEALNKVSIPNNQKWGRWSAALVIEQSCYRTMFPLKLLIYEHVTFSFPLECGSAQIPSYLVR